MGFVESGLGSTVFSWVPGEEWFILYFVVSSFIFKEHCLCLLFWPSFVLPSPWSHCTLLDNLRLSLISTPMTYRRIRWLLHRNQEVKSKLANLEISLAPSTFKAVVLGSLHCYNKIPWSGWSTYNRNVLQMTLEVGKFRIIMSTV